MINKTEKSDVMTLLLVFSCVGLVVGVVCAIGAYRYIFDGGLSPVSSDWSNFGSYIGGVFGPLVSFVTLLAVLKTIYLQRQLLDCQSSEFEKMHRLQQDTFAAQQVQMKLASDQAKLDVIEKARIATLSMIDRWISFLERKLDRSTEGMNRIGDWAASGSDLVMKEQAQKVADNNAQLRGTILELMGLSEKISLDEYGAAREIREVYDREILKIFLPNELVE